MQFMYWSISVVTLILTVVIFSMTLKEVRRTGKRVRFSMVLCASSVLITEDILWVLCEDNILVLPLAFDYAFAVLYYILTGIAAFCCYMYSDRLLREPGSKKRETILSILSIMPIVVSAVIAIISIRTGWVFTIDQATGMHIRGPLFAVHLIVALLYLGLIAVRAFVKTIMQKDSIARNRYLSIAMYSCLIIFLAPLQTTTPNVPFLNISMTLAAIHAFFFINTYERGQISIYAQLQGFGQLFLSSYCVNLREGSLERISVAGSIRHSAAYRELKEPHKRPYGKALYEYVKNYVHPDDREQMREASEIDYLRENLSTDQPYYFVTYRHVFGNTVKWNRMYVIMTERNEKNDEVIEAIICFMDVNQEQMLLARSDYFRNLFTKAATGAYQRIMQVNITRDTVYHLQFENGNIVKRPTGSNIEEHLQSFAQNVAPEFREEVLNNCRRAINCTDLNEEISYSYKGLIDGTDQYGYFVTTIRAMEYEGDRLLMLFITDNTEKIRHIEMLEEKQRNDRMNAFIVRVLSSAVEFRSNETGDHIHRVMELTRDIINVLIEKFPEYSIDVREADSIVNAAALHDIGKIAIPDDILLKPGKLTDEEFAKMKRHTIYGCQMLGKYETNDMFYRYCYDICRSHHERYDGRGYPDGLVGEQIPIWAQIVSIVDVYDALTSDRSYKKAYSHEQAVAMIDAGECGTFSPKILECFHESIAIRS